MADGTVKINTDLSTDGFKKGLSKLGSVAKAGLSAVTGVVAGVSTAIAGVGVAAAKVGSDFEAGMSEVAAISGASGDDFKKLSDKAKEMGATTKFSATESAEALKYMAMAGWDTQKMVDGLDGVMNLAAASGEDLGTVSDIVTDSMTAFGLAADKAGHFSDVLATASSSSNTNVSMLGETFKYVAPVAGSLGYSVEDTATAIGLMANAGIKGSQAGTALRSTFSRLAKPAKEVQGAMDDLGISLTDSNGKMKPLNELMGDMRNSFNGLSEAEKAQYAATIAGQEGMSGLLAIVNTSDEDFNKLAGAINNCDGSSKKMADTMNDNLKGKITLAKSALEGLGVSIYEEIQEPLKNAVTVGTGYLNQLQDAFNKNGLSGMIGEVGNVLSDLVIKIADAAPKLIDAAINLIDSFIDGISSNMDNIAPVVENLVISLVNGITEILPKLLDTALNLIIEVINGIVQALPEIVPKIVSCAIQLVVMLVEHLPEIIQGLIEAIPVIIEGIVKGFSDAFPQFAEVGGQIIDNLKEGITTAWENIKQFFTETIPELISNIGLWFSELPGKVWTWLQDTIIKVASFVSNLWAKAREAGSGFINNIVNFFKNLPSNIWNWLTNTISKVTTFVSNLGNKAKQAGLTFFNNLINKVKQIPSQMLNIGKNIVQGIWNGISGAVGWLWNKISGFCSNIVGKIKGFFGIHSPSKLMADEIGSFLPPGISIGFSKVLPKTEKSIQNDLNDMTDSLTANSVPIYISEQLSSSNLIDRIKSSVALNTAQLSTAANSNAGAINKNNIIVEAIDYVKLAAAMANVNLNARVEMDGKEVARQTSQYTNQFLGNTATLERRFA